MDAVWKAQEEGKDDAKISMDDWALRYPTNTTDVGRVCVDIATRYHGLGEARVAMPKILQFSSEDRFTKYQICQTFAEIMGLPLNGMVANSVGNDPHAAVQRPYDAHLSTRSLKELGIDVRTVDFRDWW